MFAVDEQVIDPAHKAVYVVLCRNRDPEDEDPLQFNCAEGIVHLSQSRSRMGPAADDCAGQLPASASITARRV